MKQTKKTDTKLMFKQDEHNLSLEKDGTKIHITMDIGSTEENKQLFSVANVLSMIAWVKDADRINPI